MRTSNRWPSEPGSLAAGGMNRAVQNRWHRVRVLARRVADFQARVILSVFYVVIVGPHALAMKALSDPLRLRAATVPYWLPRERAVPTTIETTRRQF